jgi:hypothetical protein
MHPLFISLQQLENGERFGETETVAAVSNAVEEEEVALGMEEVVTRWWPEWEPPTFQQLHFPGHIEPTEPSREGYDDGRKSIIRGRGIKYWE